MKISVGLNHSKGGYGSRLVDYEIPRDTWMTLDEDIPNYILTRQLNAVLNCPVDGLWPIVSAVWQCGAGRTPYPLYTVIVLTRDA
jgi:hypothetical protein